MKHTISQLKTIQSHVEDVFGLNKEQAARIVGQFNGTPKLDLIANGDMSPIIDLGYTPKDPIETKPARQVALPIVEGETLDETGLPIDYAETLTTWLEEWASDNNIELDKCAGLQWRAACLYIGQKIQQSGILRDRERERHHGGKIYDPKRLEALIYIWEYMTNKYKHIPLVVDYIAFTGVSRQYFYDYDRGGLTSSSVQLVKKVREIEEAGISVGLNDGRENPTGRIYYSKARLGWRETTEVIHVSAKETEKADILPVFDGQSGLLEG